MSLKRIQSFLSHDELDPNAVDKKNTASGESRHCDCAPVGVSFFFAFPDSCEAVTVEIYLVLNRRFTVCDTPCCFFALGH